MCTYLAKRGATYYFRRVIPAELRAAFNGKSEFMLSLQTKERADACRRIPAHTIETNRLLDTARAALGTSRQTAALQQPQRKTSSQQDARERAEEDALEEQWALAQQEEFEREERQAEREKYRDLIERQRSLMTRDLDPRDAAIQDLLREREFELSLARDRVASFAMRLKAAEALQNPAVLGAPDHVFVTQTDVAPPPAGTMLDTTIVDLWAAERGVRAKTKDAYEAAAREFYKNTGRVPVGQITRKHVLGFKDALLSQGQTVPNINTKLSRLRTLLEWASENDHAAHNPAKGVTIRGTAAAGNKRLPFELSELRAIFGSPIYSKGDRPTQGRGDTAYWLPLLALFTGARMEELGQLRLNDIERLSYPDKDGSDQSAWFIKITNLGDGNLQLKNDGSERLVPIHPELEKLGFIQYIQHIRDSNELRVFPLLKPGAYGRLTAKWGEWFSLYLRQVCKVTDKRKVFHSFRHTFKDATRHLNIEEGVQRQLMGHRGEDVADGYGSGYSLYRLVESMNAYRIPGLQMPERPSYLLEPRAIAVGVSR